MGASTVHPDHAADATADTAASARLAALASRLPGGTPRLGDVVDVLGPSGLPLAMVLFAAVTLIPGIAPAFGAGLCLLALGLLLGWNRLWLPRWLEGRCLSAAKLSQGLARLVPHLERMERVMRPRRPVMLRGVGLRAAGLAALADGVLIVLPIPFGNTAPALAALLLSLALAARDGTAVLWGIGATVLAVALDTVLVVAGYGAVRGLAGLL